MLNEESRLDLPPIPADQQNLAVAAWSEPLVIDTYEPQEPDRFPQFLDRRVYQGSSGRVFPLPFHERIASEKRPHRWEAVHLENRWVRVVVLPELGGRIHIGYDKTADHDFFYRNNVIKPALVGLTGPWISGGVEFNWPQHHRPATFLPTDVSIEREADGSVTVWCSDHDPFARMKGMHGIRLRPDSSAIEARVRLYNRSERTETFLWWANVAAAVNDDYQSFFPTDVHHVADHAKRAVATFPAVDGTYYGVDYPARVDEEHPDADRLDWYRNIPVPTSYMVTDTDDAFFGGYNHGREAGFVHWADRTISPGKKQWTWGDAPFGHAWDANLTDADGPYVELMAGVYTDNQPDFSFLEPGETRTFSQFWYPISAIGPAMQATREAAIRVDLPEPGTLRIGVAVSVIAEDAVIRVEAPDGAPLAVLEARLTPDMPVVVDWVAPSGTDAATLRVAVVSGDHELVRFARRPADGAVEAPTPAVAPPAPEDVGTIEELDLIGDYLEQYRHATRSPEPYWQEALRRDPNDVRAHVALGTRRYASGEYDQAVEHLQYAVDRLVSWAPNPSDGRAHYRLGIALLRAGRIDEGRRALGKATWNAADAAPAHLALARSTAVEDPAGAFEHVRAVLRKDHEHLQARDVAVVLLRRLGRAAEAEVLLAETLAVDPLDQWARHLAGRPVSDDATVLLDVALEYASLGATSEAQSVLALAEQRADLQALGQVNVRPLVAVHMADLALRAGRREDAHRAVAYAAAVDPTNALPSRLDDVDALRRVLAFDPSASVLWSMLGSWLYDRGLSRSAVGAWERGVTAGPDERNAAVLHRNLGVAAVNVDGDLDRAADHYAAARTALPDDARLLYETDELAARSGTPAADRLRALDERPDLVSERDDLTLNRVGLLLDLGRIDDARAVMAGRRFQPWEGGEGVALAAWDRTSLAIARRALEADDPVAAADAIESALHAPDSLGEARHPLATTADLHLALGDARAALGRASIAQVAWRTAAAATGDFTEMATAPFTERSVWSIAALDRLGRKDEARLRLDELERYIEELAVAPTDVDYFATSLPTMLLFHADQAAERDATVARLRSLHAELSATLTTDVADAVRD
ncbi:DUF5107 domain-containing protein [Curtobacterium sp. BRB10]|uniref:DUF5107 domain-containing protein n=1 Tax=Curtobacterium sp. BRB10 TaxID=2962579 RepID=UPI0028816716|nr:DUF5107 domain-containing protein [Curtobacterium sp. BRB10]MDT0234856.1 DUF5107 domain-containing protein [Curtobacterium sp. BRB10]